MTNQVLFIVWLRLASRKENITYQNPCFVARLGLLCSLFDETAQKHTQKATQNLQQSYKIHSKAAKFNSSQIHCKTAKFNSSQIHRKL